MQNSQFTIPNSESRTQSYDYYCLLYLLLQATCLLVNLSTRKLLTKNYEFL